MKLLPLWMRRSANVEPQIASRQLILPMESEPAPKGTGLLARAQTRDVTADVALVALRLAGWYGVSALATLGIYVVFFLLLGGGSAEAFFAHLANLANHFGAADDARRDTFVLLFSGITAGLFLVVSLARHRSFRAIFIIPAQAKDRS